MIDRHNVWTRPLAVRHAMNRLFQDAFVSPRAERPTQQGSAMDMYEEGENLVVKVQMPGIKPEGIDVTLQPGVLTVRGQTTSEDERKERSYVVREHQTGSFVRQIRVPQNLDVDSIQATFEHGVLRLTLPKQEQAGVHRIPITTGSTTAIEPAPTQHTAHTADGVSIGSSMAADTMIPEEAPVKGRSRTRKQDGAEASIGKASARKPAARKPRARNAAPSPA